MIEFLEPNTEDWMALGSYQGSLGQPPPAPPLWHRLSWHTDHMRRRASGMRPTEGDMFEEDRVAYSRYVRRHFWEAGIFAVPWCRPAVADTQTLDAYEVTEAFVTEPHTKHSVACDLPVEVEGLPTLVGQKEALQAQGLEGK